MTRILLTGFEPFAGESMNPTMAVVQRISARSISGITLDTAILPVDRARAAGALFTRVEARLPDWVLMLGEAGGRARVTPERVAINVDAYSIPDNAGHQPRDEPVVAGGPVAYFSTLPLRELVARLDAAAIPAAVSNSAGTYLCNHVFYALMHRVHERGLPLRGGFVHFPYAHEQVANKGAAVPSLSLDSMAEATGIMLETLRDAT